MARPDKAAAVAELTEEFRSAQAALLTDYRGLTVKQLQTLRRALGENATYAVVKNTLTKIAAKDAGIDSFDTLLVGPSAIAFVRGDVVEAAKGLRDFARDNAPLVIKGGVLGGLPLDAAEIARLADLESRETLLGKLAGTLQASIQNAAYLFNAPLTQAVRVLAALQGKVEEAPSVLAGGTGPADETSGAEPGPAEPGPAEPGPAEPGPAPEPAADMVSPEATDQATPEGTEQASPEATDKVTPEGTEQVSPGLPPGPSEASPADPPGP